MKEKKKLSFSAIVLLALALGIVVGIALQGAPDIATKWIKPFGTLYLNAIKMIIVPLVFCSIAVGACELGDIKKFGRIGGKTMAFFMVTTTCAITIGVVLANVTNVGVGLNLTSDVEVTAAEAPSIIDTIVPLLVLLLSVLLGMDRFTKLKIAGLVLGMAGAVAVVLAGASSSHQHSHLWGNVMILLCACVTSLYMVWFKRLIAKYRITTVLRWLYCVAAVAALPFGLKEIVHTDYTAIAKHALFPTLFVLTVPTYLPNLMLNYALKSVPATVSSIYTYLQPVLAIAISVGMGLDKLHADTVIFALVIFVGVGLVLRSYSVPPRHVDPPTAAPH